MARDDGNLELILNGAAPLGGAMPTSSMTHPPWYVVATKRYREQVAGAFLTQRGVSSYLPRIVQWPRPAVGGDVEPMFPGYLFVQADLPREFSRIIWTPGVKTFVTFGENPAPLDPRIVDMLRDREGPDGVIRCDDDHARRREIRIVNGPLRGLDGVLDYYCPARDRIRILVEILQRQTPVELPEKWVRQR